MVEEQRYALQNSTAGERASLQLPVLCRMTSSMSLDPDLRVQMLAGDGLFHIKLFKRDEQNYPPP